MRAINAYQKDNPPVHQLVAAYMGVKSSSSSSSNTKNSDKEEMNPIQFIQQSGATQSTYQGPRMI